MKWAPIAQSYKNLIACLDTIDILPDDIPLVVEVIYRHLYNNTHVRATKYTMQLGSEELEVYEYEIVEGKGPDQVRDLGKIDGSNKEQDNDANGGNMSDSDQRNQASNRSQNKSSKSSERVIFKNVTVKSANDGKHKSQFKYAFPELVEALKQAGKTSCDLDRELQFVKSPVDLTRYLNKYFENVKAGLDDVSFLRMSRLDYLLASIERQRRLKLPAYVSRTVKTVIGIDSSGSISDDEYEHFISIIWKHRDILEGKVVVCDCDIKSVLDLKDSKKTELEKFLKVRRGYGGTSYEPVFEIAERENVEIVIYFTDLFPDRFPENPKFKVLWVVKLSPESYSVDVPYGTVIWF
ncbi:MAG: hypothetical protein DRN14_04190 [Thermoplasmata archaeon]|nr:MAG: hypothetical protein DRN14_04190 [Thermoplasmata archaeon]